MDQLLNGLNPAQLSAVTSKASVVQVLAPPGSGKTKTLTARVSYLITQCGLKPWNIIVCTFTVKAAREMKERIKGLVGNGLEKKLILGTFHSVARRFLVSYGQHIGIEKNFGIADTADSKAILKRIVKDQRLTIEPNAALGRISSQKAKNISCEQYTAGVTKKAEEHEFCIVYTEYEAALKAANLLDYDDLLLRCAFLLRSHPQCVSNIQAVLIDEFQDTNEVQFDLMTLFAQHRKAITIVGDPDQSIYGWRNAEIKNLGRMVELYPETLVVFLEENYRSSEAILKSAQKVIDQDTSRPQKNLQATHGYGELPVLRRLPTADAEAKWIVTEVQRIQALSGDVLKLGDFSILLRSAQLSRHIETALGKAGLAYRMIGGTKFYDRAEVKVVLDYLRVVNQPEHNDALLRVLNVPTRGIGEVTVKGLLDEARDRTMPVWKLVMGIAQGNLKAKTKLSAQAEKGLAGFISIILSSQMKLGSDDSDQSSPVAIVEHLLKRLEFDKFLQKKYPEDYETRLANVDELKAQTAELSAAIARGDDLVVEENLPQIENVPQRVVTSDEDALSIFLANIALSSEAQKKTEEGAEQAQCVTISTIHAAKGLEWPVVFIPACYDGSIPHSRAEDHDEERRLLYVGMTRAQALLYLSCPVKNSQTQETTLSPFLTVRGIESYFNNAGPELQYYAVSVLAQTLRRECPSDETVTEGRLRLDNDKDDYWPKDGQRPLEENSRWDHGHGVTAASVHPIKRRRTEERSKSPTRPVAGFVAASTITIQNTTSFSTASSTLKPTFTRATSRLQELEAAHEDGAIHRINQRMQESAPARSQGKRGPKTATGAASIANYFGKPAVSTASRTPSPSRVKTEPSGRRQDLGTWDVKEEKAAALQDITNSTLQTDTQLPRLFVPSRQLQDRKPRSIPLLARPRREDILEARSDYIFLSSSPPRPPDPEDEEISLEADRSIHSAHKATAVSGPALLGPLPRTQSVNPSRRPAVQQHGHHPAQRSRHPPPDLVPPVQVQPQQPEHAHAHSGFRPAATFHTTSISQVGNVGAGAGAGARKTLGMGRSFKPWSARGGKGS